MACTFLDPMLFVPFSYPEVIELHKLGCPPPKPFRYPRINYAREFFCSQWGPSFRCICPQKPCLPCGLIHGPSQFRGVGREVKSCDYFSTLPIRPEGRYVGIRDPPTLGQQTGIVKKNPCPKGELCFSTICNQMKPDLIKGDSICGICGPSKKSTCKNMDGPKYICDDFPGFDIGPNLNFEVIPGEYIYAKPPKIRTGVERCIQPSNYRDINSVYLENFTDFMKTKTRKQISLYRSPLAIDKRRPQPKVCPPTQQICIGVNNGPVRVNAKAIKFQNCKKRVCPPCLPKKPDFEVILPGPICLP